MIWILKLLENKSLRAQIFFFVCVCVYVCISFQISSQHNTYALTLTHFCLIFPHRCLVTLCSVTGISTVCWSQERLAKLQAFLRHFRAIPTNGLCSSALHGHKNPIYLALKGYRRWDLAPWGGHRRDRTAVLIPVPNPPCTSVACFLSSDVTGMSLVAASEARSCAKSLNSS